MEHGPHNSIILSTFEASDISEAYIGWLNNRQHMKFSNQRHKQHDYISCLEYLESFDFLNSIILKVTVNKQMAGTITFELDRFNSVCTMGMLIGSEFSGQGIGSKAWGLGMDFAFSNLMARKVKAGTADENYAMQEIFKKNNMKYEATLYSDLLIEGKQQDLLIYTKFKISTQVITSGDDA